VLRWSVITIDRRFRGPAESANGGYACGVAAAQISGAKGPVEVTLRSPPPLDTPIAVERSGEGALFRDRAQLVAEAAVRTALTIEPPAPVSFDEATRAAGDYPSATGHPYPGCFVCGPDRAAGDGLRIFPGAVAGRNVAAAPWIPDSSLGGADGRVKPEIVWAALDCPSLFGIVCFQPLEGRPLLGRLTAELHEPLLVGERYVCVGWFSNRQGRKFHAGSALFSERGALRALGQATWITVP
jgi:hypothetical protein